MEAGSLDREGRDPCRTLETLLKIFCAFGGSFDGPAFFFIDIEISDKSSLTYRGRLVRLVPVFDDGLNRLFFLNLVLRKSSDESDESSSNICCRFVAFISTFGNTLSGSSMTLSTVADNEEKTLVAS